MRSRILACAMCIAGAFVVQAQQNNGANATTKAAFTPTSSSFSADVPNTSSSGNEPDSSFSSIASADASSSSSNANIATMSSSLTPSSSASLEPTTTSSAGSTLSSSLESYAASSSFTSSSLIASSSSSASSSGSSITAITTSSASVPNSSSGPTSHANSSPRPSVVRSSLIGSGTSTLVDVLLFTTYVVEGSSTIPTVLSRTVVKIGTVTGSTVAEVTAALNAASQQESNSGLSSENKKIIIGVVAGVGGTIILAALLTLMYRVKGQRNGQNDYREAKTGSPLTTSHDTDYSNNTQKSRARFGEMSQNF